MHTVTVAVWVLARWGHGSFAVTGWGITAAVWVLWAAIVVGMFLADD